MVPSRLLLDSHILVWLINGEKGIGAGGLEMIHQASEVYVSAASVWELNIKTALGQMTLPEDFEDNITRTGFVELPIRFTHARAVRAIQMAHADPFDRLLVAQAKVEGLAFLTADKTLLRLELPFVVNASK